MARAASSTPGPASGSMARRYSRRTLDGDSEPHSGRTPAQGRRNSATAIADLETSRRIAVLPEKLEALCGSRACTLSPGSGRRLATKAERRRQAILEHWGTRTDTVWGRHGAAETIENFVVAVVQDGPDAYTRADELSRVQRGPRAVRLELPPVHPGGAGGPREAKVSRGPPSLVGVVPTTARALRRATAIPGLGLRPLGSRAAHADIRSESSLGVAIAWWWLHAGTLWLNAAVDRDEGEVLMGAGRARRRPRTAALGYAGLASLRGSSRRLATSPVRVLQRDCVPILAVLYSHPADAVEGPSRRRALS